MLLGCLALYDSFSSIEPKQQKKNSHQKPKPNLTKKESNSEKSELFY